MTSYDYDLFVLGAGSGGVRAARKAASTGIRVGIAEMDRLGGTCVNQGCVPKKLYTYAAHFQEDFADSRGYGWDVTNTDDDKKLLFSWQRLQAAKDQEILRLNQIYADMLIKAGVDIFYAQAHLLDEHSLKLTYVDDHTPKEKKKRISAQKILIATGSSPFVPDFLGKEYVTSSEDIFKQKKLPQRIVIVGGGYIAVEFAGIFANLGCQTSLIYRGELFLRNFDMSIRNFFYEEMQKKQVDIHFKSEIQNISQSEDLSLSISLANGKNIFANQVVYATGRLANTTSCGLKKLGISLDKRGNIQVDDDFRTNISSIYSLGDSIGRVQLTPVAIAEASHFVAKQFMQLDLEPINYNYIPTAVFSQPSIGTVGLTEAQAREKYPQVKTYTSKFRALKHSLSKREEKTLIKLVVDEDSDRVLGAHYVGAEAGEIIQGLGIALQAGATKKIFDATIAVHPTVAEEFVSLS